MHKLPALGALDVVGRDRRVAWQKLGRLSADQARAGFVELLSRRCPLFSAYIEAHRREKKEQERKAYVDVFICICGRFSAPVALPVKSLTNFGKS